MSWKHASHLETGNVISDNQGRTHTVVRIERACRNQMLVDLQSTANGRVWHTQFHALQAITVAQ